MSSLFFPFFLLLLSFFASYFVDTLGSQCAFIYPSVHCISIYLRRANCQFLFFFFFPWKIGNITTTGRRLDRENLTEHILEVNAEFFLFFFFKNAHLVSIETSKNGVCGGDVCQRRLTLSVTDEHRKRSADGVERGEREAELCGGVRRLAGGLEDPIKDSLIPLCFFYSIYTPSWSGVGTTKMGLIFSLVLPLTTTSGRYRFVQSKKKEA